MRTTQTPATDQLADVFARHGRERSDLIPILQEAQDKLGYLSKETMRAIARQLRVPASSVLGVATFYAQFYLQPRGRHRVVVCRGTACHVRGSREIREGVEQKLGIREGETTEDLLFSYETVACLGNCALAPLLVIDDRYHGRMTRERAATILDEYLQGEAQARGTD
ncbi:MAG: NADH-quinone oxidoreductase subunit NuoE [Dehalococcoidia bacterium]|nr:NADH-quinone oxidoreductase subunit NuoE [Dehalococcoidia bacterium]